MRNPPRPLLERLSDLARGWAVLSDDRGLASADIADAIAEIESLRRALSDSQRKLDRMSQVVTPDRNMAEQIALYLDGQARTLDGSSMEYMQLRRAAEWMRCLNPAPDTQALRDYAELATALLWRIHGWDMMDTAADGRYWRAEIEAVAKNPNPAGPVFTTEASVAERPVFAPEASGAGRAGTVYAHETGKIDPADIGPLTVAAAVSRELQDECHQSCTKLAPACERCWVQNDTRPPEGERVIIEHEDGERLMAAWTGFSWKCEGEANSHRITRWARLPSCHQVGRHHGDHASGVRHLIAGDPNPQCYPNLSAMLAGCVSGPASEWPAMRAELRELCDALEATQERYELLLDSRTVAVAKAEL